MHQRISSFLLIFALTLTCGAGHAETTSEAAATAPKPFLPVPNPSQLKWHRAEYRMFIHFGMKTFYPSNNHMGSGKEDPKKFNPHRFDAKQWVEAAKAGGFEGLVFTTKHHDGFCNWPTDTTTHSVKAAPWKDGQGDLVKELIDACRQGGITFGIYVSILDHHFNRFGSKQYSNYSDFYLAQIRELSTRYGPFDEYWFDGFESKNVKVDYQKLSDLIRETQPNAVVYDSGTLVKYLPDRCLSWPNRHGGVGSEQNYRREIDGQMRWYPNEPSVILQGNWFHNGRPITSLERIQHAYLTTVGHSVTPLLNIAPNQEGLIDESTVDRLTEFKAWVDRLHDNDLAQKPGVKITADQLREPGEQFQPANAIDGDSETYYASNDQVTDVTLEINLGKVQEVAGFILQEPIALGQRVNGYQLECWHNGRWEKVFAGQKIGYKRIILEGRASARGKEFPATDRVRLKITGALACPLISAIQVIGAME